MTQLRVYLATSIDGYIADADGGVDWLTPYTSDEVDFAGFQATIGATVFGRRTYDQSLERGVKFGRSVVLTHRRLENPPPEVEGFAGDVRELAELLRAELAESGKDVWLMGGGESIRPFHQAGLVDRWEIFLIPILLGDGVPLFPPGGPGPAKLRPTHSRTYSNGIVELRYEPVR